ncbi:MAG: hypothetical protein V3S55_08295 [Nitrospiraceae bacterium]
MAQMSDVRSVAANTTVANVLAGKSQEFITEDSIVRAAIVAAAVGMFATILIGEEVILEDQEVSGANRFPTDPDDFNYEGAGVPGERIVLKLRNSTGAAIVVNSSVKVEPA